MLIPKPQSKDDEFEINVSRNSEVTITLKEGAIQLYPKVAE